MIGSQANFWDTKQESHEGDKEFENPGRRGRRRPAEVWSESYTKKPVDSKLKKVAVRDSSLLSSKRSVRFHTYVLISYINSVLALFEIEII